MKSSCRGPSSREMFLARRTASGDQSWECSENALRSSSGPKRPRGTIVACFVPTIQWVTLSVPTSSANGAPKARKSDTNSLPFRPFSSSTAKHALSYVSGERPNTAAGTTRSVGLGSNQSLSPYSLMINSLAYPILASAARTAENSRFCRSVLKGATIPTPARCRAELCTHVQL